MDLSHHQKLIYNYMLTEPCDPTLIPEVNDAGIYNMSDRWFGEYMLHHHYVVFDVMTGNHFKNAIDGLVENGMIKCVIPNEHDGNYYKIADIQEIIQWKLRNEDSL
jgi:hypothetical protein